MFKKYIFQINAVVFHFLLIKVSWIIFVCFHKNSRKTFPQISILEWFLKDYVTLKTGKMEAENLENSALPLEGEKYTFVNILKKCVLLKCYFSISIE